MNLICLFCIVNNAKGEEVCIFDDCKCETVNDSLYNIYCDGYPTVKQFPKK